MLFQIYIIIIIFLYPLLNWKKIFRKITKSKRKRHKTTEVLLANIEKCVGHPNRLECLRSNPSLPYWNCQHFVSSQLNTVGWTCYRIWIFQSKILNSNFINKKNMIKKRNFVKGIQLVFSTYINHCLDKNSVYIRWLFQLLCVWIK